MISIKINGIEYSNVASVDNSVVYDFHHSVTTMDGKRHRLTKGKRTNFDVTFYNRDYEEYSQLKKFLSATESVDLEVPDGYNSYKKGEYLVTVGNDMLKGKLIDGVYYSTGLSVSFEKVGYDE